MPCNTNEESPEEQGVVGLNPGVSQEHPLPYLEETKDHLEVVNSKFYLTEI